MPAVSVIVPVYKVEAYLTGCVNSILNQTYRDFELILVDDGSPDACGEICDRFANSDRRIKVIHQQNQGLSGARNAGIEIARGDYITFVDSDDLISFDYLSSMVSVAQREQVDIVVCRLCEFLDDDPVNLAAATGVGSCRIYRNTEACVALYNGRVDVPVNAWGKLYNKKLIEDMRFPVGRIHEDQAFVPIACYQANKLAVVDSGRYHYRARRESITKQQFSVRRYDDIWAVDRCIEFFQLRGEAEIVTAAQNKRKRLLCVYAIYAHRDRVAIPKEFCVGLIPALAYLRKNVSSDKFDWYLSQVNAYLPRISPYLRKIEQILMDWKVRKMK